MWNIAKSSRLVRGVLILLPVIAVALFVIDLAFIHYFNSQLHTVEGNDNNEKVYFDLENREDSTSSWLKRDFELNGTPVDLNAQTFDATMYNNSQYQVADWTLTLRIQGDCYVNNGWCGTMEIHQHVGTADEKVQTLDLRKYELDQVILDYTYDGDLLIPLSKGDYIVYYPSEVDDEYPLDGHSQVGLGYIFYYLDGIDLSSYTMEYQFNRSYSECVLYQIMLGILLIWLILLNGYIISRVTYRVAIREMEMKKSGISAMSDIYSIIYIVDMKKNELIPVVADKESEKLRPVEMNAQQQLTHLFEWDAAENYKGMVLSFCDLSTLKNRMVGKNTIVCEYISKNYGWCQLRFFTMDADKKGEPDKYIFAIQVINEEKEQLESLNAQVKEKTENIIEIQQKLVVGMANIIENRDNNTGGHVKRTSEVIHIIVDEVRAQKAMEIDNELAEDIVRAAPMHDLGKIYIDSSILCKPGRLTAEEYEIMKSHSTKSGEMVKILLDGIEEEHFVSTAYNIARYHHERWDGKGYPEGLSGNNIPVEARIMAIADVYDALVSKRCYKEAMSFEKAYQIMVEGMGSQFDPGLKDVFIGCHKALEEYYSKTN